ncbi:hypothetical protein [Geodermatophilus sp. URMC 62]|uniref:hypothetical protein n=1 Tax=Geodermatophilus sp. URMC 62 TaxID=3423414 RepID=UPI00406C9F03
MSTSALSLARRPFRVPSSTAEDGLGLAGLLDLLGIDPADTELPDGAELPADTAPSAGAAALRPADLLARTRAALHRAADWGAGPQRSWCAW